MSASTPIARQPERRASIPTGVQNTGAPNGGDPSPNPQTSTPGAQAESSNSESQPPPTPTDDSGAYSYPQGPQVISGPPSVYPVVYSVVDANGYQMNVGTGAPQVLPTAAYYISTPVFGYPSEASPGGSYYVGNNQCSDGTQMIYAPCYPNGNPPTNAAPVSGSTLPTVFYPHGPSQNYPSGYSYVAPNSTQWIAGCSCLSCRNGMPVPPQQPPTAPPGNVPNGPPNSSPITPAFTVIQTDQELLAMHRPSVTSTTSPAINSNGASPAISNGVNGGAITPLSSRQPGEGDMRRRLYQGPTGGNARVSGVDSNEESLATSPALSGMSERKKRKMGYLNNILYKTEICRDYQQTGSCPRGKSCQFAHGGNEVHHPKNHPLYKTAFCFDFKKDGKCPRGDACFHVHHSGEMRDKPNRSRGTRGPRFAARPGRANSVTPKNTSPLVFSRSRNSQQANDSIRARAGSISALSVDGQPLSPDSSGQESYSGETLPSTSDVKNTMLLLQRLSSENTATLLKKMAEDDALRGSPVAH